MTAVPAPTPQSNEAAQAALIDAINPFGEVFVTRRWRYPPGPTSVDPTTPSNSPHGRQGKPTSRYVSARTCVTPPRSGHVTPPPFGAGSYIRISR